MQLLGAVRSPLYRNALSIWASTGITSLGGLVFWAIVAARYTPEEVGLGSAAVSAMTLLAVLAHLGLGYGLIRYLPRAGSDGSYLINGSFGIAGLASVIAAVAFLGGIPLWAPRLEFLRGEPAYVVAFGIFVAAATAGLILDNLFIARRRAEFTLLKYGVMNLVRVLLPIPLALFIGPFGIVAAGGVAALVGLILGLSLIGRVERGYRPAIVLSRRHAGGILPFAVGNYLADLTLMAPGLVLPIMVMNLLDGAHAGYFYVAWFMGSFLHYASTSLALSMFAEGTHAPDSLRSVASRALPVSLLLAGLGAVAVFLAGDHMLLVFGQDYAREGGDALRLVALAAVPAAVTNVYLGIERARGGIKGLIGVSAVVAVVTLGLSYVAIPELGIKGGAVGLLAGQTAGAWLGVAILVFGRRDHHRP